MSEDPISAKVGQVFVPGGLPTYTYHPRKSLALEQRLTDYLDEGHKIVSLSGPTKAGKTVLLKSRISDGIWLSGGDLSTIDDFWDSICNNLGAATQFSADARQDETATRSTTTDASVKPLGMGAGVSRTTDEGFTTAKGSSQTVESTSRYAAQERLGTNLYTLVIDDFHYIEPDTQMKIVRALKPLVFDGLPVVIASVPHRAYDAVRVEKEMTGRVEQLQIPIWQPGELATIAKDGFAVLNVSDPQRVRGILAAEAYGSPHLMQDFCLQLCKSQDIRTTQIEAIDITPPVAWPPFFRNRASAASKSAYDLLARGPRQRTDRKQRTRTDGVVTDIYGAVLTAIAFTGPKTAITYEELRSSIKTVLLDDPPERHEVTRVLDEMTKIARNQIEGEPVLDYDPEFSVLHISDPFFAYFLKWGFVDPFLQQQRRPL